ncbi:peptidylprolyl isomerase [Virgisporangium aliadipatigenens]|uniref:peptidylprolyl isomerase n=1 Tax=Virgisporangium aliadipatigenens TaxID=741659 RepID=UPI001944FAC5|nr:peptidylprolyl isomerase [Virgisporangium aliadipatigenens]
MARTKDRQRALARAKLERQIARRAAAARRKRQIQAGTAAGIALVLVVLGGLWIGGVFEPDKVDPLAQKCAWTTEAAEGSKDVGRPPTEKILENGFQTMKLTTNKGELEALIDVSKVPCTAASFTFLAGKDYFKDTKCHRLTTEGIFVLQCGDPAANGKGGPGYKFADENLPTPAASTPATDPSASASAAPPAGKVVYKAGTIAMANSGADTNGSQFFIVYQDSTMDPNYAVLGTVTKGLDVVQTLAKAGTAEGNTDGAPKEEVVIQSLTMSAGEPAPSASASTAPSASSAPSASTS